MFIIYFLFALDFINTALYMTTYAKFVILLNGSYLFVGLLGSTCALIGLVWKLVAGSLSENKSCKTLLLWCLIPCVVGNLVTCFATTLPILFAGQMLCAFGSPVQTLLRATVIDMVKEKQAAIFNKIAAVTSLAFTLGAIVSGSVIPYDNGLRIIYFVMSLNFFVSLIAVYKTLPNLPPKSKSKKSNLSVPEVFNNELTTAFKNLKTICFSDRYSAILTVRAIVDFTYLLLLKNLGYRLRVTFDFGDRFVAFFIVFISLISVVTNLVLTKLSKFWKQKTGNIHSSLILSLLGFAGLVISSNPQVVIVILSLMTVVKTILESQITEELLSKIVDKEKGLVFSTFESAYSLSELTTPLISSIIAEYAGIKMNYVLCCLFYVKVIMSDFKNKVKNA